MDADFSIELGSDDPILDFPWIDPSGKLAYVDLKRHPELVSQIPEAQKFPELVAFLRMLNSPRSSLETAKCDAWATTELNPEEEIYDAPHKFASYVDVVFSDADLRLSFAAHERFAEKMVALLKKTPDTPSAVEVCVRRCYFSEGDSVREGFYFTLYVSGYGGDEAVARLAWEVALRLAGNAAMQALVRG
jgi:hypothetical protein